MSFNDILIDGLYKIKYRFLFFHCQLSSLSLLWELCEWDSRISTCNWFTSPSCFRLSFITFILIFNASILFQSIQFSYFNLFLYNRHHIYILSSQTRPDLTYLLYFFPFAPWGAQGRNHSSPMDCLLILNYLDQPLNNYWASQGFKV